MVSPAESCPPIPSLGGVVGDDGEGPVDDPLGIVSGVPAAFDDEELAAELALYVLGLGEVAAFSVRSGLVPALSFPSALEEGQPAHGLCRVLVLVVGHAGRPFW